MANTINWGKIYESTAWGNTDNSISWGKSYADLAGGGGGFDADYQAVLDYATTQGYTAPSASQQTLQNQLIIDLKDAGAWSKLDSFCVRATDGDSNFSLIDWKRLVTTTAVNSPTFTSNQGFTGDGASSYIDNLYNPTADGVNWSLNSVSLGAYLQSDTPISGFIGIAGHADTNLGISAFLSSFNNNKIIRLNSDTSGVSSSNSGSNFYLGNRPDGSTTNTYVDGSLLSSVASTTSGIINYNLYSLCRGRDGSANAFNSLTESLFLTGGDLTAEQADVNSAINTYMSAI